MIDWIKFSERQPEKEGQCLCYSKDSNQADDIYLLHWHPPFKNTRGEMSLGYFSDDFAGTGDNDGYGNTEPDYWAEINPPLVRQSGQKSA